MAHLKLMLEGREVRTFPLDKSTVSVGRAQDNDIIINNLALSRRHAEVRLTSAGAYELIDLGSQNGVYVNSTRLKRPQALKDGDAITMGTYKFVYHHQEASDEADAAAELEPVLVLTFNDVELQRLVVADAPIRIGRGKECGIQIAERRLSRNHCEVYTEGGRHFVRDLGSQNGTYVNRARITSERLLQDGDILNFAEYSVSFFADAPPSADSEPPQSPQAIAAQETVLPPVYEARGRATPALPAKLDDNSGGQLKREPIVERPSDSRNRRTVERPVRAAQIEVAPTERPQRKRRKKPVPAKAPKAQSDGGGLDAWYDHRAEQSGLHAPIDAEPSQAADSDDALATADDVSIASTLNRMMVRNREVDQTLGGPPEGHGAAHRLRVLHEGEAIFEGPVSSDVLVMGAGQDADIPLKGRYVARRHSLIVTVRESLLFVRLGSSSAARINGLPKLQAFLRPGDRIQIDETTIEILD